MKATEAIEVLAQFMALLSGARLASEDPSEEIATKTIETAIKAIETILADLDRLQIEVIGAKAIAAALAYAVNKCFQVAKISSEQARSILDEAGKSASGPDGTVSLRGIRLEVQKASLQ